jgi:hypothetical protein
VRQDLRESLVGVLHHNEEKIMAPELAASGVENGNQVRMG